MLFKMYKFLSCNNLDYSEYIYKTKRIIKCTKRQNKYIFISENNVICFLFTIKRLSAQAF